MIETNLRLLETMIQEKREPYAILSFLMDTLDARRTNLINLPELSDEAYLALRKVVVALKDLEGEIEKVRRGG